jgi:hypothetical protein
LFEIFLTDEARNQLERLKKDKGLEKRYNAVKKALHFLSENPRHKSLKTHEFTSLSGPKGEKSLKPMPNNPLLLHIEFSGTMGLIKTRSLLLRSPHTLKNL